MRQSTHSAAVLRPQRNVLPGIRRGRHSECPCNVGFEHRCSFRPERSVRVRSLWRESSDSRFPPSKIGFRSPAMARNGGKNPHGEKLFGYNRRDFFEMTRSASTDVTKLLLAWSKGNARALDELIPVVHRELRAIARRQMAGERPDHTLQATALVNEAYLRLVDLRQMQWQNRAHFFGAAAQVMRRVLVDFARKRNYLKRGGGQHAITLIEDKLPIADGKMDLVALDDALTALAELDERK